MRVRVTKQIGQRVTREPSTQVEYMEDLTKLLSGQARDAQRAAAMLDAQSPEAAVMEGYGDALVAAGDSRTGGHDWALIQRAMRDELGRDELRDLDASDQMRTVKAASKEAALMSWSPTTDTGAVNKALDRFWEAYEAQDKARTLSLGEVGTSYDRSRLVSEAWETASGGASVADRVRVRSELVNFVLEEPDSPTGQMARDLIYVDRSNGTTQTKVWDAEMGRDRSQPVPKTGPDLDMVAGQEMSRPVTDPGFDR